MAEVRDQYETALELNEFVQLETVDPNSILNGDVEEYVRALIQSLNDCYRTVENNRRVRIDKNRIIHDRVVKKVRYELGDKVLVNHPKISKGSSQGINPKYWGPFEIVGRNRNGVTYLIKNIIKPKSKVKQIHVSNLKTYYDESTIDVSETVNSDTESDSSTTQKKKKKKL